MRVIFTMNYSGRLLKMETKLKNPVEYELPIGDELVFMNHLIGKYIIFLDSDDVLLPGSLKKLYQHILLTKTNIVVLEHNELKNNYKNSIKRESEAKGFFKKKTF